MPSNFESLVFEIIATDKNASAAFDRFRGQVDKTSRSVDDNTTKLDKNSESLDRSAKSATTATPAFAGLAGVGGMGALIGAGVALSPIIATVGTGLGGLGLAAFGVVSPVLKAAQAAGGLKANMAALDPEQRKLATLILGLGKLYTAFEKSLQPQVLGIFGKGIQLAGHLMGDLQPIAKSTGIALQQVLGRIDAEFKSGTWQQFFRFMATTAAQDVQLLGNLIVDLTHTLPTLLENLQPVAVGLLSLADAAVKAADGYLTFIKAEAHKGDQPGSFGAQIRQLAHDLLRTSVNEDQLKASQEALNKRLADGKAAAGDLIHPVGTFTSGLEAAKVATDNEKVAVTALTTALKGLSSGLLTTEQDQVSWKQAQQAATQAIKANTGSLNSNRATALTARAAIIASTQAALAFASQEVKVHGNVDAASAVIRAQIAWLQTHAGHSRIAAAEVDALRAALAKLHDKRVTLTETGTGKFSIFGRNTSSTPKLAGGAQGLFINRGTSATADDVLVRASKGELIVPTKMVSAGLVDHLRGMIPGFAAGGLAGLPGQTAAFDSRFQSQFTAAMKTAMTSAMRSAIAALTTAFRGKYGAGVAQWRGDVLQVLRMLGLPLGDAGVILAQMQTESGGNPNAINLTDSNAAMGDPSRGLMQTIMSTFEAYRSRSLPDNIYNPLANIYAGVNYAIHRYGNPGFLSVLGHGHGYDAGGWLPPGPSLAYNGTGQPEAVVGGAPLARVEMLLTQLVVATQAAPARTAAGVGGVINGTARAAGQRAYYGTR